MLILDSVQPEKWYSVKEAAAILGFSDDTISRQVTRGLLKAFILPNDHGRNRRAHKYVRIQGCELVRYVRNHMNRN
jgi:Helix-turn-helix domain